MTKEEYLILLEKLKKTQKEIRDLDGVRRNQKVRKKLKTLKRKESDYTKILNNFNGSFIENKKVENINSNSNYVEIKPIKKNNGIFSKLKRKIAATAALVGTAVSIIAGGISFSASALEKDDSRLTDNYYSIIQENTIKEEKKEVKKEKTNNNELNSNNGIRVSSMDFDTFVYNTKFTIKKDAKIYNNIYDAKNKSNVLEPYFESDKKREVKGITIEYNEQLYYFDVYDEFQYYNAHELLCNGGNVVSVTTSIDGINCEGIYNISDVDIIYTNEKSNVLKK